MEFRKELKIPHKLTEVAKIRKEDIDKLSLMALEDPSTSGNPKQLKLKDMKIMYEHSLNGELF